MNSKYFIDCEYDDIFNLLNIEPFRYEPDCSHCDKCEELIDNLAYNIYNDLEPAIHCYNQYGFYDESFEDNSYECAEDAIRRFSKAFIKFSEIAKMMYAMGEKKDYGVRLHKYREFLIPCITFVYLENANKTKDYTYKSALKDAMIVNDLLDILE